MAEGKLIAVMAFDVDEAGELYATSEGEQCQSEMQAKIRVASLATRHAGAMAWSRPADPLAGEYGEPTLLLKMGRVPDHME
jgi:hypothetical protein